MTLPDRSRLHQETVEMPVELTVSEDPAELVRSIYLERRSGTLVVSHARGVDEFLFRRGELFLDRDHRAAVQAAPVVAALGARQPSASPELRTLVEGVARRILMLAPQRVELRGDRTAALEVVGPLPTVWLVQELAVGSGKESDLVARLGGRNVPLRSSYRTPALEQLPGLDPAMSKALVSLEHPSTLAELLRGAGGERKELLQALVRLWAVGLARAVEAPETDASTRTGEILSPKLLRSFRDRIGRELAAEPLTLEPAEHRRRIADHLARLGEVNHYQLLDVELGVDQDGVLAAYNELARLVHPDHAGRLGLTGKEEVLRVLFERATEAYLTLSDPRRRASYNTMSGLHIGVQVDEAQRAEEKRRLARANYRRAVGCLAEMEFTLAIELLKEAVRMDPQAEYYAALGQAQGKNPHWRSHAVGSYRQALRLKPDDAGIHFGLGELLEKMEQIDEAREAYAAALELMPDHPGALEALERLGGRRSRAPNLKATGDFRSLFGGSKRD